MQILCYYWAFGPKKSGQLHLSYLINNPATLELREIAHWQYQVLVLHRSQGCFLGDLHKSVDSACTIRNPITYTVMHTAKLMVLTVSQTDRWLLQKLLPPLHRRVKFSSAPCDRTSRVWNRMFWNLGSNISLLWWMYSLLLHSWQIAPFQDNRNSPPWKIAENQGMLSWTGITLIWLFKIWPHHTHTYRVRWVRIFYQKEKQSSIHFTRVENMRLQNAKKPWHGALCRFCANAELLVPKKVANSISPT